MKEYRIDVFNLIGGALCIEVDDRKAFIQKVKMMNYPLTIVEKEPHPLVFIQDKFGNNFEIFERTK